MTNSIEEVEIPEEKKRVNLIGLVILIILLLGSLGFICYQNGWGLNPHAKEKTAIKEQIEKVYFGIANGAYTSNTIQGTGTDGMPFYNLSFENITLMGLTPLANIFGFKIQIEPKNINVYHFINDNTAQVQYNLLVHSRNEIDTAKIDMIVKKIGGYWKLDGEKFLGEHKSSKASTSQKKELSTLERDDNYLSKDFINNPKNTAWKIHAYKEDADNLETQFQDSEFDSYLIFTSKKVYLLINGRIDKLWHVTKQYSDNEYFITETKEGYILSQFGNITVTNPRKYSIEYEGYDVPIKDVVIDKYYIR